MRITISEEEYKIIYKLLKANNLDSLSNRLIEEREKDIAAKSTETLVKNGKRVAIKKALNSREKIKAVLEGSLFLEEITISSIAKETGLSYNTVKNHKDLVSPYLKKKLK
jgi:DNA-directed RNA polymerase specialized sigma24 family protein